MLNKRIIINQSLLALVFSFLFITSLYPQSIKKITVQLKWKHQFQFAGFYTAIQKGYYTQKGLSVSLIEGNPSIISTDVLFNGTADFSVDMPSVLIERVKGKKVVVLAAILQHSPVGLFSLKNRNIQTVHDLINKRVMLPNRPNTEILALLKHEGMELSDIQIIKLETGIDRLLDGTADVTTGYITELPYTFKKAGQAFNVILPEQYGLDFYGDCLYTSSDLIRKNPKVVKDFLEATLKGWQYALDHQDEIINLIYNQYSHRLSKEQLKQEAEAMTKLMLPRFIEIGHMNPYRWEKIAQTYAELGLISSNFNLNGFMYSSDRHPRLEWLYLVLGILGGFSVFYLGMKIWQKQLHKGVSIQIQKHRELQKNYREIFNSTSDAIFIHDAGTGRILEVNQSMLKMYGYNKVSEVLSPQYVKENFAGPPYDFEKAMEKLNLARNVGPQMFTWLTRKKNGETFWVDITLRKAVINGEERILAVVRDINERKMAEKALSDSESKYQTIFNAADEAIFIFDAEHLHLLEINDSVLKLFGYSDKNVLIGKKFDDLDFNGDDRQHGLEQIRQYFNQTIETGYVSFEWNLKKLDGSTFWASVSLRHYTSGEYNRILAIVNNIENYRQMNERIRINMETQRALLESLPGLAMLLNHELKVIEVNQKMCSFIGYERQAILSMPFSSFFPAALFKFWDKNLKKVLERKLSVSFENEKENRYYINYLTPLFDQQNNIEMVAIFILDISERRIIENYNSRLAAAVEHTPDGISIISKEDVVEYINTSFSQILEISKEEVIGRSPKYLMEDAGDPEIYKNIRQTINKGEIWRGYVPHSLKSGEKLEFQTSVAPILIHGELLGMVSIHKDDTQLRSLEADLRQAQKIEAIGNLAGGIAHDFNNILTGIMGYTELAQLKVTNGDPVFRDLEKVYTSALRAKDLVDQILTFSRKTEPTKSPIKLKVVIEEVLKLLTSVIPSSIKLVTELDSEAMILANPIQIHQIIMNLCTNAFQAMTDQKGIMTLRLSDQKPSDQDTNNSRAMVILEISDNGVGMDGTTLEKIFEPYFTTKKPGEGTGLGLSVVLGIVKNHQGDIKVKSNPGKGSTFTVILPVYKGSESISDAQEKKLKKIHNSAIRIFFLDDEKVITALVKNYFQTKGYIIQVSNDPHDVINLGEKILQDYDILITDMTMPEINGREVIHAVKQISQDFPVILCSGYMMEKNNKHEEFIEDVFIAKPLVLDELEKQILLLTGTGT